MQTSKHIQKQSLTKVWDPLVRSFHWLLAAAFLVAYASGEDFLTLHVWAGYTIAIALIVRLIWGFIGTRHARFSDFITRPSEAMQYAKDTLRGRAKRYLGHNPAGALMIIVMLVSLGLAVITGFAAYGAAEHAGPLASWFVNSGKAWKNGLEEVHEFFANFSVLLILIHLAGVLFESLLHKENLVSAMINGYKRPVQDDLPHTVTK